MRCPNCGFVSFDDLEQCKRCGFDLAAMRSGEIVPSGGLLGRLKTKLAKKPQIERDVEPTVNNSLANLEESRKSTQKELEQKRERDRQERAFLAEERRLRDERARLRKEMSGADRQEQSRINAQLSSLEEEWKRLRSAEERFESQRKEMENRIRKDVDEEKRKWAEKQRDAEKAEAKAREQWIAVERQRQEAEEEAKRIRNNEQKIRQEQEIVEHKRREIEAEEQRMAAEREELTRQREQLQQQAQLIKQKELERLEKDRTRLAEEAKQLQEQQERLAQERLEAERVREEAQAYVLKAREEMQARIKASEKEKVAPVDRLTKDLFAKPEETQFESIRNQWRQSLTSNKTPTAADYVEFLNRGRMERDIEEPVSPQPKADSESALTEVVEEYDDIIIEEELEENEQAGDGQAVVPKGGLIFRGFAGAIDLLVLTIAVGLFLVLGRLISGMRAGGVYEVIVTLGIYFYLLFMLLAMIYFTYMHGVYGQTLGKRLLGLRVVTTRGEDLGYLTSFFRFVAFCFSIGLLGMGVVWIALDPNKQGWHDKLARTVVIRI